MLTYSNQEILDIKSARGIPDDSVLWIAKDGTLLFCRPGITNNDLNLNLVPDMGTYDRRIFSVPGVYLVVPPKLSEENIEYVLPEYTNIAAPLPPVTNGFKYIQIRMNVLSPVQPRQLLITVNLDVLPQEINYVSSNNTLNFNLDIVPIPLDVRSAFRNAANKLLKNKIDSFFDQDRVGKTLINFGDDYQMPVINWQYDPFDPSNATILVKTYRPLPPDVPLFSKVSVDRELSPSLIDQLYAVFIPRQGLKVYLRPPNKNLNIRTSGRGEINDVTLTSLLTSQSFDPIKPDDPILNKWFITSLEGAELNVDYNNFSNFVFYSSAKQRVSAFKQKMLTIENYDKIIKEQSSSIASVSSGLSGFTSSISYPTITKIATQREDLIRSFDGFERHLYYATGSSYSSSFSGDDVDQLYFMSPFEWPKVSGFPISVTSASRADLYPVLVGDGVLPAPDDGGAGFVSWLDAIEYIADEYDRQNQNQLVNNLPEYIVNDHRSQDFIKFMHLIGHHFDILKLYADAMPEIYDRNSDPFSGLSVDMIWNVAKGFGINLPNQYAIKALVDYTIGEVGNVTPKVYRDVAAETWKRFLHNHIFLVKSKGTKAALRGLLNSYGVLPTTVQIRESSTPSFYTTRSYEIIEEQTNVLNLRSGSFISIPWSGSQLDTINTIQTRFSTTTETRSVLYNVDNNSSLQLLPVSRSFGKIAYFSGSNILVSSSAFPLYNGTFYNTTLQKDSNVLRLWIQQTDENGDLTYDLYHSSSTLVSSIWETGNTLYLGSSGTVPIAQPFNGYVDEFRLWSDNLTENTIRFHAKYPGLYNGNTVSSAKDSLVVRLSFNKPVNLGSTPYLFNESPYIRVPGRNISLTQFSASGFANEPAYPNSMEVFTRNILRYAPNVGGSQFVTNKIIISDPPELRMLADTSGSTVPVLSHKKSMVTLNQKNISVRSNNLIGLFFSVTDAINDSIIRSIGNINIQDYIGNPSDLYEPRYKTLDEINNIYWSNYAYVYNYNSFVEFVDTLLQPVFIQAQELIPARSKLLSGIVLEPHILERNKVRWKMLETTGTGTSTETVNPTLETNALSSQPNHVTATNDIYNVVVGLNKDDVILGTYDVFESSFDIPTVLTPNAENVTRESSINLFEQMTINSFNDLFESVVTGLEEVTDVDVDTLYIDDTNSTLNYLNFLLRRFNASSIIGVRDGDKEVFNQLLVTYRPRSRIEIDTGINPKNDKNYFVDTIEPYINFSDVGVINYFTRPNGVFLTDTQVQQRVGDKTIVPAGTWSMNTTYLSNQYVLQRNQSGSAAAGNGYEYLCITPLASGSFISKISPSLDTNNWRRMKYVFVKSKEIRIVTNINGTILLTDSGSGYTPFVGYSRKHFRFYRDNNLSTRRRLWLGCKQTGDTTSDGGPVVEIIPSAGDTLIVNNGAEPIQRPDDNAGPILNVR
jgi:hypothetical protein